MVLRSVSDDMLQADHLVPGRLRPQDLARVRQGASFIYYIEEQFDDFEYGPEVSELYARSVLQSDSKIEEFPSIQR